MQQDIFLQASSKQQTYYGLSRSRQCLSAQVGECGNPKAISCFALERSRTNSKGSLLDYARRTKTEPFCFLLGKAQVCCSKALDICRKYQLKTIELINVFFGGARVAEELTNSKGRNALANFNSKEPLLEHVSVFSSSSTGTNLL